MENFNLYNNGSSDLEFGIGENPVVRVYSEMGITDYYITLT